MTSKKELEKISQKYNGEMTKFQESFPKHRRDNI